MVGMVCSITASRMVILHNMLHKGAIDNGELQHRTWVLAVTVATEQWAPESSGHALGV